MKKKFLSLSLICCLLSTLSHAQNWLTTGNTGTNSANNFVGTKDFQPLVLRVNNAERLRINTLGNIGIGTNSPLQKLDVVGNINIRSGFGLYVDNHPVLKVDSLNGNVFLGSAVAHNNSGFYNTASGNYALSNNTSGFDNTANGYASLFANTTGTYNTANGKCITLFQCHR